ncbi:MAG: hypothetical protein GWN67_27680 [Phycisphaerae bacterium]|nr:hypothetical protein [Phycisphaerae bacterium]NIS54522.1 hypothetical protein [Phycisphaerae bacterium]NIU12157.1 hypothetical protein [Phycisphaerae bacterium]NIU60002.1 hypothetical protein [Phycisphaerae bacterium]NIW96323.1 hypothetical protein [Phycisphaerae bacterium]
MTRRSNQSRLVVISIILMAFLSPISAKVIYVDVNAPGPTHDGSSWANAYKYLQDALADAVSAVKPVQIHVAQGIYKPDQSSANPDGSGDRYATFQLINSVTIKGGYAGFGEPEPNERDIEAYETILSGDLDGNDVSVESPRDLLNEPTRSENSYNVTCGRGNDCNAVIDGFTVTAGNANGSPYYYFNGGGINNIDGNPTVLSCKFYSNSANYGGGGMSNGNNSPNVVNCQFIGNAASRGGGMDNSRVEDSLTVLNCAFSGNAAGDGGGMYNFYCSPTVINCTFNANSASSDNTGGMLNWHRSSPTITNCIFWGNSNLNGNTDEAAQLSDGTPAVNYCCVQGWTGGFGGIGNSSDDPLFVESLGADNIPGTEDDNPRLLAGSPCLDAGDNSLVPPSLTIDLDGNPRIINGTVDIGAYEGPKQGFLLSTQSITVPESQTATFTVALATDPLQTVQVAVNYHSGDLDITVQSGTLLTFNPSNYSYPQTVTLAAAEDADYLHGKALIWISATAFVTAALDSTEVDNDVPAVLYVDTDAPGANDGTSWKSAFINLQDAISIAVKYHEVREIRVAKGIYKPDEGSGIAAGDKTATFHLINGVTMKGSYAGFNEPDPNARDFENYKTVLSGDLADNDVVVTNPADMWGEQSRYDNSSNVVTGSYMDANSILDGFTITSGYNSGLGAGMYNRDGNPTVTNCTFTWNCAEWGGGMGNWNSSPKVISCKFERNAAQGGGGMNNVENSNTMLTNCIFSGNSGFWLAGGMLNGYAGVGGSANPILNNCLFIGNSTDRYGGGIYNDYSNPIINNCTFIGNAAERGGGIYYHAGVPPPPPPPPPPPSFPGPETAEDTILTHMETDLYDKSSDVDKISNCILWANKAPNGPQIYLGPNSIAPVSYSNIQGGWTGVGNIDANPCFADVNNGDYHLKSQAGRWDPNSQTWVRDDVTSPCIDASNPGCPLGNEPNDVNNVRINMGAYGGTAEASKSPAYWRSIADITNDWIVDSNDLKVFCGYWLQAGECIPADLNRSRSVDSNDFAIFSGHWRQKGPGPGITYQVGQCTPIESVSSAAGVSEPTRFNVTVEGSNIQFEDLITANCCADEIELLMTVEAGLITIYEIEHTTMPCTCICDYPTTATLGPFEPETYILEVYQDGSFIGATTVTIGPGR